MDPWPLSPEFVGKNWTSRPLESEMMGSLKDEFRRMDVIYTICTAYVYSLDDMYNICILFHNHMMYLIFVYCSNMWDFKSFPLLDSLVSADPSR